MRLALFDLDDTLLDGDCSELWNTWMIERGWIDTPQDFLMRTQEMQAAYHAGHLLLSNYLALTLSPLIGRREEDVQREVETFVTARIEPRLFPQGRVRVAEHHTRGDRVMIVSASSRHLVAPVAAALGIPEVIAVDPVVDAGRYTGGTVGELSYRGGKVTRLHAWLAKQSQPAKHISFYSDSHNDLPLLIRADQAVAVNPDPVLAEVAQTEEWPRLDWRASAQTPA
ncbi:HAD family hydrolase [Halomonas halocynthiae]|uniref:HAD family hydrolase n=1 Tax=Halomonas halocynthiae TaxID=176290 RepID=UPI00040F150B|nr:HAD family hydrolase [Halomonas halocynthiae]